MPLKLTARYWQKHTCWAFNRENRREGEIRNGGLLVRGQGWAKTCLQTINVSSPNSMCTHQVLTFGFCLRHLHKRLMITWKPFYKVWGWAWQSVVICSRAIEAHVMKLFCSQHQFGNWLHFHQQHKLSNSCQAPWWGCASPLFPQYSRFRISQISICVRGSPPGKSHLLEFT